MKSMSGLIQGHVLQMWGPLAEVPGAANYNLNYIKTIFGEAAELFAKSLKCTIYTIYILDGQT